MDNGARGAILGTYAVYIPAGIPQYYPPSPVYLPTIAYMAITSTAPIDAIMKM
jgi:hypothetical protein